jgi:hypothetical protein
VVVPPAVVAELNQERTPDLVRNWLASAPEWLQVQAPIQGREDLRRGLGAGERDAIAFAAELSADALLVDDRDALIGLRFQSKGIDSTKRHSLANSRNSQGFFSDYSQNRLIIPDSAATAAA